MRPREIQSAGPQQAGTQATGPVRPPPIPLRVVIVEDQAADAELMVLHLEDEGYAPDWTRVETEAELIAALEPPPDLVLSDWRLPRFSGLHALEVHLARTPDVPFIVVSGSIGEEAAIDVLRRGAADYVIKDRASRLGQVVRRALDDRRLRHERERAAATIMLQVAALEAAANGIAITDLDGRIEWVNPAFSALTGYDATDAVGRNPRELVRSGMHEREFFTQLWDTILAGRTWHGELQNRRKDGTVYNEEQTITPVRDAGGRLTHFIAIKLDITERKTRERQLAVLAEDMLRSTLELSAAYETTIEGWSHALDLRDKETEGHTLRVTELTMRLARAAGIPEEELLHVRRGALLHDIGKMGVPDAILLKPGKLTDDEWVIMRKHPQFAWDLLHPIAFLRPALDIPFCHHEKFDGTGYPRGLAGEAIPFAARLFAVIDVWDALRSDRPYRPGWEQPRIVAHIKELSGTHFDPKAVALFCATMGL